MMNTRFAAKELLVKLDGGLGNRIRPTLSALFISHKLNIPAAFSWTITKSCLCPVEKLFELRVKWVESEGAYLRYWPNDPLSVMAFERALREEDKLRLKSSVYFETFHNYYQGEAEAWIAAKFDDYFVPNNTLMKRIFKFASAHKLEKALGVHVRRGDRVRFGKLPCLYQYAPLIDCKENNNNLIFLSTDDGGDETDSNVIRQFRSRYGNRLVYRQKKSNQRDLQGIQDALIDLWLLRSCRRFIGAKCSTFSETAAIGRTAVLI